MRETEAAWFRAGWGPAVALCAGKIYSPDQDVSFREAWQVGGIGSARQARAGSERRRRVFAFN
jgi:hypothetical protein